MELSGQRTVTTAALPPDRRAFQVGQLCERIDRQYRIVVLARKARGQGGERNGDRTDDMGQDMHTKHERTLARIFADPVPANIKWRDIEALFVALGGELVEGRGSRVTVFLEGTKATFHRPHPRPDTDKGAVRAVRRLLVQANVRPGEGNEEPDEP